MKKTGTDNAPFEPPRRQLKGRSIHDFDLLGKPCVGASYAARGHSLDDGAECLVCGKPATQCHHWPVKGIGGASFTLDTPRGSFGLRSPLFAVCGLGNAGGCHGKWHSGAVRCRWEWDGPSAARMWSRGEFPEGFYANSPELFGYGRYVLEIEREWGVEVLEIRGEEADRVFAHPDGGWALNEYRRLCGDDPDCSVCPFSTLPQEREGQQCEERVADVLRFPGLYEVRGGLVRPIFDRKFAGVENHAPRGKTGAWNAREGLQ